MPALNKHILHLAAVGSCVHISRTARTSRNTESKFQSRQSVFKGKIADLAHCCPCVTDDGISVHKLYFRLGTAHIDYHRVKSVVRNQHIASVADYEWLDIFFFTLLND